MRSHSVILRQISEKKLDPSVPHVVDKNGMLVPKHAQPEVDSKVRKTSAVDAVKEVKNTEIGGEKKFPFHPPIPAQEESVETILEKSKKKAPPPKKKKKSTDE